MLIELVLVFAAGLVIGYLVGWNRRRLLMEGGADEEARAFAAQHGITPREAEKILKQRRLLNAMAVGADERMRQWRDRP